MKQTLHDPFSDQSSVQIATHTDIGNVRTLNEDSIAVVPSTDPAQSRMGTMLIVADGLGGYNAGDVASKLVTTALPELYRSGTGKDYVSDLINAVHACNGVVRNAADMSERMRGMGTTVVAAVLVGQYVIFAHVGDSRGYLFRRGELVHRTTDHSLRNVATGLVGGDVPDRFSHVLTRAIGPTPDLLVDVTAHRLEKDDVVLLCSDGLTNCVGDDVLRTIVLEYSPADAARLLVNMANDEGGEDNISVIVARIENLPARDSDEALLGVQPYLVP